ncbi:MAG: phenylalanine--tRNA ligase subunit beta, partial [Bryobacteraceae bacterium]|nr:phenylalanine--tRNA ligase subunit beta [Bryobacteraceae bacterium]
MLFSYTWLRELVENLEVPPAELMQLITLKTAECEGVSTYAPWLDAVCAARIDSVEVIEGSKNVKATVDTVRYGRKTVVCGAPNCRPGIVTAYVPAGTTLGGDVTIQAVIIAGVSSDGMLASAQELGINRDHSGILELSLEPGASLDVVPQAIIEVDNKSLTHRPDLWGHYGMAREVAAITGGLLRDPVDLSLLPVISDLKIAIAVEDFDLCPRYSALVFDNVKVQPSPLWLQARLEAIGLNPINNIVDVTNYVMAEIAQPMHAF